MALVSSGKELKGVKDVKSATMRHGLAILLVSARVLGVFVSAGLIAHAQQPAQPPAPIVKMEFDEVIRRATEKNPTLLLASTTSQISGTHTLLLLHESSISCTMMKTRSLA